MVDRLAAVFAKCQEIAKDLKPPQLHRNAKWVQEDIDVFDAISREIHARKRIINGRRRIRRKNALGSHTAQQWLDLIVTYKGKCAYCGRFKPLTRDHMRPISKGGSDDISNIVPACRSCNSAKGAK